MCYKFSHPMLELRLQHIIEAQHSKRQFQTCACLYPWHLYDDHWPLNKEALIYSGQHKVGSSYIDFFFFLYGLFLNKWKKCTDLSWAQILPTCMHISNVMHLNSPFVIMPGCSQDQGLYQLISSKSYGFLIEQ